MVMPNADATSALDMLRMQASEVTASMRSNFDVAVNFLFSALQQMVKQGGVVVAHTNALAGAAGPGGDARSAL